MSNAESVCVYKVFKDVGLYFTSMASPDPSFQNLMSVNDAAAMFRRPSRKNDPPHTRANHTQNNRVVNKWKRELLEKVAVNGKIPAATVTPLWNLYIGGLEIPSTILNYDLTPPIEEKQLHYWRDYFEKADLEDLWELGKPMVGLGWAVILKFIRFHDTTNKYKCIYEGSDDPYDWYSKSLAKRDLFLETNLPFWTLEQFQDIFEMVTTFLGFQTGPQH